MKKRATLVLGMALMFFGVAGCTGGSEPQPNSLSGGETAEAPAGAADAKANAAQDNVLFFYTAQNHVYEDENNFNKLIGQYIKKKFPDLEVKHVAWNDGTRYEDLIAKGTIPDIVYEEIYRNTRRMIGKFGLEFDLSDLIKKYNFDTSKLEAGGMAYVQTASDGKVYSLPFEKDDYVLVYNKDIFDKFGVDYPQDGMTYDEAYELAKKMTRQDGDVTYKGYQQHPSHYSYYNQLAEPALNPHEDKASMTTDTWVKIVNNIRRFYEIPGNQFTTTGDFPKGQMAMSVDTITNVVNWATKYPDLHFDLSTVPVFPEAPDKKYQPNYNGLFITKQSNKKDVAFQVIQYLLSDEVQAARSKEAIIGPSNDEAVHQAFAQNVPQMKGKHVQAIFALQSAVPTVRDPGLTFINPDTWTVYSQYIFKESKDTATALRLDEELMNQHIAETKSAKAAGGDGTAWQ